MTVSAATWAAPARTSGNVRIADPDRRCYAFAIDRLIGWGIDAAVAVAALRSLDPPAAVLLIVATSLAVDLVFAALVGTTGATPGTALLGLRLVHTDTGAPIGTGPALLRTLVLASAAVPFGFGLAALAWTALADPTGARRGWHDHLVSSIVLDTRTRPVVPEEEPEPPPVANLTALRLAPVRPVDEARRTTARPARPTPPPPETPSWQLAFDHGDRVVVDTLVLIGRHPEPRSGEEGARLIGLPSSDLSVSRTHAHVVVARDGALVITDRGSTNGSALRRRGRSRPLQPGRPTTLVDGDVVAIGDRTMTVQRIG